MGIRYLTVMKLPQKKIIFIHIPKCGGSSIAAGLFDSVGIRFGTYLKIKDRKKYFSGDDMKHATAATYKNTMKSWDDYYKFSVVRNPWDRFVSALNWQQNAKKKNRINISEFMNYDDHQIETFINSHRLFSPMTKYVLDRNGEPLLDDIFDLKHMNQIRDHLQIKKINKKIRNANKIEHMLNDDAYAKINYIVQKFYKDDIDYFGYKRDSAATKNVRIL